MITQVIAEKNRFKSNQLKTIDMRKIFFAVLAATALFAGCAKEESSPVQKEIKVNFTVAEKSDFGADTKAVKTGWENGDEILIVTQIGAGFWYDEDGYNCFKLKYNGSNWTTDMSGFDVNKLINGTKLFMAIHYPGTITLGSKEGTGMYRLTPYKGGEVLQYNGQDAEYSFDGTNIDLGTIQMQRHIQDFQISVTGLASEGKTDGTWKLCIKDGEGNSASNFYYFAADKALLRDIGFGVYSTKYSTGINYGEDVVFYFTNTGSVATTLKFELTDGTNTYTYVTNTIPKGGKAYYLPAITDLKWD